MLHEAQDRLELRPILGQMNNRVNDPAYLQPPSKTARQVIASFRRRCRSVSALRGAAVVEEEIIFISDSRFITEQSAMNRLSVIFCRLVSRNGTDRRSMTGGSSRQHHLYSPSRLTDAAACHQHQYRLSRFLRCQAADDRWNPSNQSRSFLLIPAVL